MRSSHMTVRRAFAAAGIVAVVSLFAVGVVIAANTEVKPVPEKPPVSSVPADVSAAFAVFRRPAVAADSSEGATSAQSGPGLEAALGRAGANVHLSRHIGPAGSQLFATVGQERVCLFAEGESSCAAPAVALGGHLLTYDVCGDVPANHIRVSGLTLDGVSSVTLKDANGAEQAIPVQDNGFTTLATGYVVGVDWTKDGEAHEEPISYPYSAETNCAG